MTRYAYSMYFNAIYSGKQVEMNKVIMAAVPRNVSYKDKANLKNADYQQVLTVADTKKDSQ